MNPKHTLTQLNRLARRRPQEEWKLELALKGHAEYLVKTVFQVAVENGNPIGRLLANVLKENPDPALISTAYKYLPSFSIALREVSLFVIECHLQNEREKYGYSWFSSNNDLTSIKLSRQLSANEQHEEALEQAREAMNNLRVFFSSVSGENQSGITVLDHSLSVRSSEFYATETELPLVVRFRALLAMSICNYALRLKTCDRHDESVKAAKEATDLFRDLMDANPRFFRVSHARAVAVLATCLDGVGQKEAALEAFQDAANRFRDVYQDQDIDVRGDYAQVVENIALILKDLGRLEDALAGFKQAAKLLRPLSDSKPDVYGDNIATSLNNLGAILVDLGRQEEALPKLEEAVTRFQSLLDERSISFLPALARSTNGLAVAYCGLGSLKNAEARSREAVALYRNIVHPLSGRYRSEMAVSLDTLASCLIGLERFSESLAYAEEAVGLFENIASEGNAGPSPELAMALHHQMVALNGVGRLVDAFEVAEKSLYSLTPFFQVHPTVYKDRITMTARAYQDLSLRANRDMDLGLLVPVLRSLAPPEMQSGVDGVEALASGQSVKLGAEKAKKENAISDDLTTDECVAAIHAFDEIAARLGPSEIGDEAQLPYSKPTMIWLLTNAVTSPNEPEIQKRFLKLYFRLAKFAPVSLVERGTQIDQIRWAKAEHERLNAILSQLGIGPNLK